MTGHRSTTSRLRPTRPFLVMVLGAVLGLAGCSTTSDIADPVGAPVAVPAEAREVPVVVDPNPSPTAIPPVETAPPVGLTAPRPQDDTSEPDPSSAPDPITMSASAPVRLRIPAAGVDSTLIDLGLQADGRLEVPPDGFPAGWYTGAPTPGELGPAIIAGHVDWGGRPGVFHQLRRLAPGDQITISREDGTTAPFQVTRVERFAKDAFPTRAVYGDLDHAGLRLITCGGAFDEQARSYEDNIVVFAELIAS